MKNIVIIGGGTGTFTLLSGLRQYPANNTVIISSADDGGSTGVLRKELGVFPPGDIRQCLVGLSYTRPELKNLFNFRFNEGFLAGHTAGNILLAALEKITGNAERAVEIASKILNVRGQVLPVTLKPTILTAILKNGKKIVGEHLIDEPVSLKRANAKPKTIEKLELSPSRANPKAISAIKEADVILFGPGDLYTSILPNLLAGGMRQAVEKSSAKKILIINLMTKYGQTDGFKASDFVRELSKYLGKSRLDAVVINDRKPSQEWLRRYQREQAEFVWPDISEITEQKIKVAAGDLLADCAFSRLPGDKLKRSFLRHNPEKTAKLIWQMVNY
ncbi:MAG: YvcK family protein [Patescibacteria group bacterium]|nr:YvcK family protein [Patescibacteria group bacterium]